MVLSSSKHSGRCQQAVGTAQSLSQAELTFAAPSWSQHTGERPGERRVVREVPGARPGHHLLRFGPDAVHHACCCNRHLKLSALPSVLLSATTTSSMYSLQWRQREGCPAHEQTGAVFGSLCTHTHSTPLHSSPLCSSYASLWVRPHWSCMLACWGPHYDHLSSCKHCN